MRRRQRGALLAYGGPAGGEPFADWLKYTYDKDDSLFLVPEMDCLRVYSSLKHEIIRCVGARGRREA